MAQDVFLGTDQTEVPRLYPKRTFNLSISGNVDPNTRASPV